MSLIVNLETISSPVTRQNTWINSYKRIFVKGEGEQSHWLAQGLPTQVSILITNYLTTKYLITKMK